MERQSLTQEIVSNPILVDLLQDPRRVSDMAAEAIFGPLGELELLLGEPSSTGVARRAEWEKARCTRKSFNRPADPDSRGRRTVTSKTWND